MTYLRHYRCRWCAEVFSVAFDAGQYLNPPEGQARHDVRSIYRSVSLHDCGDGKIGVGDVIGTRPARPDEVPEG